jgi:hypothetical protein
MENGVSGCRVGRACRNDNEDNALGERASGRTSSSAHRGEPIVWVAKAPQRNGKRAALERQARITTDRTILAPLANSDVHITRSLLSTERRRK